MNFVIVIFILAGVQFGSAQLLGVDLIGIGRITKSDQRYHGRFNNTINMHACRPPSKAKFVKASVGPCYDTDGCKLPYCCGVISGVQSQISITYKAARPLKYGKGEAFFSALGLGSVENKPFIRIPSIKVPNISATYYSDLCRYTKCPQVAGNTYTVTAPFKFITKALTTLGLIVDFKLKASDENGAEAACFAVHAKILNVALLNSALDATEDPILPVLDSTSLDLLIESLL